MYFHRPQVGPAHIVRDWRDMTLQYEKPKRNRSFQAFGDEQLQHRTEPVMDLEHSRSSQMPRSLKPPFAARYR
jgi:hypothetical protein